MCFPVMLPEDLGSPDRIVRLDASLYTNIVLRFYITTTQPSGIDAMLQYVIMDYSF